MGASSRLAEVFQMFSKKTVIATLAAAGLFGTAARRGLKRRGQ
jgi:hypothetical protein